MSPRLDVVSHVSGNVDSLVMSIVQRNDVVNVMNTIRRFLAFERPGLDSGARSGVVSVTPDMLGG